MRYFLGFDLSAKDKLAIEHWRSISLPHFERSIPAKNFHVTSVFLGQVTTTQLDLLTQSIEHCHENFKPFELHLDQYGYWSKPKILWLGCSGNIQAATQIHGRLKELSQQAGIVVSTKPYVPHVSIVRKAPNDPPSSLIAADFKVNFDQLHLFESVSGKSGVQYPIRQSWRLNPFARPQPGKR
ncbi:RNA 2',3'-cyclic phosphodiesterase [Aliiglaciecola sp. M165]|uniref:RNA 2',3'-cyclic phosphodiesterase n=1 Tax=Aliiglaciecola sp. M165 TaxID=2593649 RepID=UPI00163D43E2|nr:RNA 2',3'-cyclic phosphodiesterase [Aliiglaciecola sp. M165]